MNAGHFISIKDLLSQILPVADIELPADNVLEQIKLKPAAVYPDPVRGVCTETQVIVGHRLEARVPFIDTISIALGGSQAPIGLRYTLHPSVSVLLGPLAVSFYWDNDLLIPVVKVVEGDRRIAFERDPDSERFSLHVDECWLSYSEEEGLGFDSRLVISIPPFMVSGTELVLGVEEAGVVFGPSMYSGVLTDLGFDESFRGVFANEAVLYWLPEIRLRGFDAPGLRLDLREVAIGNQGVSLDLALSWEVEVSDEGYILSEGTELLGSFFDDSWQVALASASGRIRRNVPEALSVKAYLRIPYFQAVFSASFGLAYRVPDEGSAAYKTTLAIRKESDDPIVVAYFGDEFVLTIDAFQASGLLSDQGFTIAGQVAFHINLFGFVLEVGSAELEYLHLEKLDDFRFKLRNVVLGDLGEAAEARLLIRAREADDGNILFETLEVAANLAWQDLEHLIPQELRDLVGLPDDGTIEALISWEESEADTGGTRQLVVQLKTGVSHLDNLWRAIPPEFRPQVRRIESIFVLRYDSAAAFVADNAASAAFLERDGVSVSLTAQMELRLPGVDQFPQFDLLRIDTGDEDGFITAEFDARFADGTDGTQALSRLTILNPFSMDLHLPGTAAGTAFVHNEMSRVVLQFSAATEDDDDVEIGGALGCEGEFVFRPLVPAAMPFADAFNSLMHGVGLDEIIGRSALSLEFTDSAFDVVLSGEFEEFGVELDVFRLLAGLATSGETPDSEDVEIDFDIRFHLIGFTFNVGYADDDFYFSFDLKVECSITGLAPVRAAITLSNEAFSFGLEDLSIPLEIPRYPIDSDDLALLRDPNGRWTQAQRLAYEAALQPRLADLDAELALPELDQRRRFRLLKDKSHLELKVLMLQLVMAVHQRVASTGQPTYESLIELDTMLHDAVFSLFHVETDLKLKFPEIKFRIPFDDPTGISIAGEAGITGFAPEDPLRPLEDFRFTLGLSSQYIFLKIESTGEALDIPSFGTRYDDGSVSISKFAIGYGYTKNSFALDFAGELVLPTALVADADTSQRLGVGVRLPRHNKLAFKIDLIPVTIGKATVVIPLPQFDIDLRSPEAPALTATEVCSPHWDGLEFLAKGVVHADFKRLAFSPFFGMGVVPNIRFDGDLVLGDEANGLTVVAHDTLTLLGVMSPVGPPLVPIPFFADPTAPYFENLCINLRVAGFQLNFDLQRPFPSMSPLAAIEAFGLLSDPTMAIDPHGSLANTIRVTLSDAYLQAPGYALQMFPDAANFVDRRYDFTLNLGTLITMMQSLMSVGQPMIERVQAFVNGQVDDVATLIAGLDGAFDPWTWVALLPPELRKFRTGGQIGGFEASACLVLATAEEAAEALANKGAGKRPLNDLSLDAPTVQIPGAERQATPAFTPTDGFRFATGSMQTVGGALHWRQTPHGVAVSGNALVHSHLLYVRKPLPEAFSVDWQVTFANRAGSNSVAGVVLCYQDEANHYALRLRHRAARLVLTLERVVDGVAHVLGTVPLWASADSARVEVTSYRVDGTRQFAVAVTTEQPDRSRAELVQRTAGFRTRDSATAFSGGLFGFSASGEVDAEFSETHAYKLNTVGRGFNEPSQEALVGGFNVNLPVNRYAGGRHVTHAEAHTLFDGIEFRHFDEDFLERLPLGKLLHLSEDTGRIYIGARVKVFGGQRFRFLGALYADGSFALISEVASKPLRLTVFNVPIDVPFTGYGNLTLFGRQKRSGFYGAVEARGYVDWSPIPNIVRIIAGSATDMVSLTLHSSARFALRGSGTVSFFGGAVEIDAAVDISEERASFAGDLRYMVALPDDIRRRLVSGGGSIASKDARPPSLIDIDVAGAGEVENLSSYRFEGRGRVTMLGQEFAGVDVELANRYARFGLLFHKPRGGGTAIEDAVPLFRECELTLDATCTVDVHRAHRPAFELSGDGVLKVLGAELRGSGSIVARPAIGRSARQDFFEVRMAGALSWQGRQWLGGRIVAGSRGLTLAGTTHFGVSLTPEAYAGIDIASLYLNIKLEGEFRVDAELGGISFLFKGDWTLGAAMANTGNSGAGHRQMLPLAASRFTFASTVGVPGTDYRLQLFRIDGFKYLPFDGVTVPVPTLTPAPGAKPVFRMGLTKIEDIDDAPSRSTVEFDIPAGGVVGARAGAHPLQLPDLYDETRVGDFDWTAETAIYSPSDMTLGTDELTVDLTTFENLAISLVLKPSISDGFPLEIVVE